MNSWEFANVLYAKAAVSTSPVVVLLLVCVDSAAACTVHQCAPSRCSIWFSYLLGGVSHDHIIMCLVRSRALTCMCMHVCSALVCITCPLPSCSTGSCPVYPRILQARFIVDHLTSAPCSPAGVTVCCRPGRCLGKRLWQPLVL